MRRQHSRLICARNVGEPESITQNHSIRAHYNSANYFFQGNKKARFESGFSLTWNWTNAVQSRRLPYQSKADYTLTLVGWKDFAELDVFPIFYRLPIGRAIQSFTSAPVWAANNDPS